ncbi:MAG: acyl-coenzyme A synthetase/AMP-(fatty) acid ligase [Gammaproteobacteria bacterium]|jgi:acyl-coenzyme A synthetase/AMP-(fatty) acid ligase
MAERPRTGSLSAANVAWHLTQMAASQPERLAIACPANGLLWSSHQRFDELSFRQLDEWSQDLARGLVLAGIRKGTRVVLLVPPGPEFFAAVFALMKTGAVMICIDPGIGVGAMGRCIDHSQPHAIIGSPKAHVARRLLGWGRDTNKLNIIAARNSFALAGDSRPKRTLHSLAESGAKAPATELAATDADDLAAILFTSGSTGPPKGVLYSHATFQSQIRMLRECYGIRPGEIDLSTFPLFALFAPALGMSAVIPKMDFTRPARVSPANIIGAVKRYQVTSLFGSPALLRRLVQDNKRRPDTLPSLRRIISAGAPVPASVLAELVPMLDAGVQIHTPYGATEILPVSSLASDVILGETAACTAAGQGVCVGAPLDGVEARILSISDGPHADVDPLGLTPGAIGEIIVSGPNLSLGYDRLEDAQRHARFCDSQGRRWHRMGDSGYIDVQGRLWFCGRVAHRVVTLEGRFFPIPCEGVFNTHPKVYRSALVRLGTIEDTRPGLCVELEARTPKQDQVRIRAELLDIGAGFEHTKAIREIFFHSAFPVDIRHNAKIDRERLGEWARSRTT